jgi:hypothetical protein
MVRNKYEIPPRQTRHPTSLIVTGTGTGIGEISQTFFLVTGMISGGISTMIGITDDEWGDIDENSTDHCYGQ